MPRDVSLSDSKCWNGGHEWVNVRANDGSRGIFLVIVSGVELLVKLSIVNS